MVITNPIEVRCLKNRQWKRPYDGLRELQVIDFFSRMRLHRADSVTWRKKPLKKYREEFQAALFTYGLQQQSTAYMWEYSYGESPTSNEYDCLVRCELDEGRTGPKPVQLKELASLDLKPQKSLQQMINELGKYTALPGKEILVVAIFIRRATTIKFKELRIPAMSTEQLWLYGFLDPVRCFLTGNLLGHAETRHFEYPRHAISEIFGRAL